jgi:thiamine biosynthesis lipoprotein
MGIQVRIAMHAPSDSVAREAARAAFARIAELDEKMSDYRPRSEVRLLSERPGEWQAVSRELLEVLVLAREVSRASRGAFDVTTGPLVGLWREARRAGRLPDSTVLADARARSGWEQLEIDSISGKVRLVRHGMKIDLGGIAKGYIIQEAIDVLRAHGIRSALVEAGGDVVVGDAPPGTDGWSVEIPDGDAAMRSRARALVNVAVSTSGGSEQFIEVKGTRYSHVIDPRTGVGVTGHHLVTVIAPDAALADAAATALSVMGQDLVRAFRERFPVLMVSFR